VETTLFDLQLHLQRYGLKGATGRLTVKSKIFLPNSTNNKQEEVKTTK